MKKVRFAWGCLPALMAVALCAVACSAPADHTDTVGNLEFSGTVYLSDDVYSNGRDIVFSAGTRVMIKADIAVKAVDGASIRVEGTAEAPVVFVNQTTGYWGGLLVSGEGSLVVHHALLESAPLVARDGASLEIEDSVLHGYLTSSPPIVEASRASQAVVRRTHVYDYYEIHFYLTPTIVEDCLLERMVGDGIDFDNAPEGSVIRGCTIRNATNWNVDAVDFGILFYPTADVSLGKVEDCLIYNVTDKGISVGEGAAGVSVQNCLIHHVGIGLAAKDGSVVICDQLTLADNNFGVNSYEERDGMGGGKLTIVNSVIAGNQQQIQLLDGAELGLSLSLLQGPADTYDAATQVTTRYDGAALFEASGLDDYRLAEASVSGLGYQGAVGTSLTSTGDDAADETPVKVAVFGYGSDLYGNGPWLNRFLQSVIDTMAYDTAPDLVFLTGDLMPDTTSQDFWANFSWITKPLRKICPVYAAPGEQESNEPLFSEFFGELISLELEHRWFAVRKDGSLFLVLDSTVLADPDQLAERQEQLAWLSGQLALSVNDPVISNRFVVIHQSPAPFWSEAGMEDEATYEWWNQDPALIPELRSILEDERWKVDMVFSGHRRIYARTELNGVQYVVTNSLSNQTEASDILAGTTAVGIAQAQYCLLLCDADGFTYEARDLDGTVLDQVEVAK